MAVGFYHKDVKLIQIKRLMLHSYILLDLFARDAKRGGAWMNDLVSRFRTASVGQKIRN